MSQSTIPDTDSKEVALMAATLSILAGDRPYANRDAAVRTRMFVDVYHALTALVLSNDAAEAYTRVDAFKTPKTASQS